MPGFKVNAPAACGYNGGMETRLTRDESLADGVRRLLAEGLGAALGELHRPAAERDAAVHECRKQLKVLRALVRLARADMRESVFDRWNTGLRDAGRALAPARDAAALVECVDGLLAAPDLDPADAAAMASCRETLLERSGAPAADESSGTGIPAAKARLVALLNGLETSPLRGREPEGKVLLEGLRASHCAARCAWKKVAACGGVAEAHEWRKRAKDLRYQVDLLAGAWPAMCAVLESELHRLTDALGLANDVAAVEAALGAGADLRVPALLAARREAALAEALALGALLHGEPPRRAAARLAGWWLANVEKERG